MKSVADEMPEPVRDLKRALRTVETQHFSSLRELAKRAGLSPDTASRAVNGSGLPAPETLDKILAACGLPRLDDGRYDYNWLKLYGAASDSMHARARHRTRSRPATATSKAAPIGEQTANVASAYIRQVLRIAPEVLHDRHSELAELADFCTQEHEGSYMWWRAPAWAGKSALMSWFVLNPPPGVQMVSFFVTARFAGQNDRIAFVDVVMEQLAQLLGRPVPVFVTDATRDAHLLALLADAAIACQENGRRLILMVDGLDEDCGVSVAPDAYSIAALLPARPVGGMRIVVAGRTDPRIPADVPEAHPLRDARVVQPLVPSPHAQVIKADAHRELKRLLTGAAIEKDLLGLVATAGGGLSCPDLAELTGHDVWQVQEYLNAFTGRTFTGRLSQWQPDSAPEVYLLCHDELQNTAIEFLRGVRLAHYWDRLQTWSDFYAERRWPLGTPEYLLHGYYRMLIASGDITRVIAYAADRDRHNRMLELSGGDIAAHGEITTAQDLICSQPSPDLLAMLRLALHRNYLADRNTYIPANLPALWAALGDHMRAAALAMSITDSETRGKALVAVAEVISAINLDQGESFSMSITDNEAREDVITAVAKAAAAAGDPDRAEALARSVSWQVPGLTAAAAALAAKDPDRAAALASTVPGGWASTAAGTVAEAIAAAGDLNRAETLVQSITDPEKQQKALAKIVRYAVGEPGRAESMARSISRPYLRLEALTAAAVAAVDMGDIDHAEALARSAAPAYPQVLPAPPSNMSAAGETADTSGEGWQVLIAVAKALAHKGDPDRAASVGADAVNVARSITKPRWRAQALTVIAVDMAHAGHPDLAYAVADEAERLTSAITNPYEWAEVKVEAAEAMAAAGRLDEAETVARSITNNSYRLDEAVARSAIAAASWDLNRAETLARSIVGSHQRIHVLTAIANAAFSTGDRDAAVDIANRTEVHARSIANPTWRAWALATTSKALAATDPSRAVAAATLAEVIARSIRDPCKQAEALAAAAESIAAIGDTDRADEIFTQVEAQARSIADSDDREETLVTLACGLARTGHPNWAESLVESIANPGRRAAALADLATAVANISDPHRSIAFATQAIAMAESITDPELRADAMSEVAAALPDPDQAARLAAQAAILADSISEPEWRAEVLTQVAKALARAGKPDQAAVEAARAEAAALSIRKVQDRAPVIGVVAEAVAAAGDHTQAEALARSIPYEDDESKALVSVVSALAGTGEIDRAETLAGSITDPYQQGRAFTAVAAAVERDRARPLIASALRVGRATTPMSILARLEPGSLAIYADEFLASDASG